MPPGAAHPLVVVHRREVGRAIFEQRAVAKADGLAAFEAVGVRAGDSNILAGVVHDRPKLM